MNFLVRTEQIKERPLPFERDLTVADLEELMRADPPTGYRAAAPAHLDSSLTKVNERDILFQGQLSLSLASECRRCVAEVSLPVQVAFELNLVDRDKVEAHAPSDALEDDGAGEIAGTFSPDAANQVYYSGREIDLAPMVREQVLLALPMGALCTPDCKGLCQVCGQNLNQASCSCDRHVPDPRWAGLKNIKV